MRAPLFAVMMLTVGARVPCQRSADCLAPSTAVGGFRILVFVGGFSWKGKSGLQRLTRRLSLLDLLAVLCLVLLGVQSLSFSRLESVASGR